MAEATNWVEHAGNAEPWYIAGLGEEARAFDARLSSEEADWLTEKIRAQEHLDKSDTGVDGAMPLYSTPATPDA